MSSIFEGVLDAFKLNVECWHLACVTIEPYWNHQKRHQEHQHQSRSSSVLLASSTVINFQGGSLCLQIQCRKLRFSNSICGYQTILKSPKTSSGNSVPVREIQCPLSLQQCHRTQLGQTQLDQTHLYQIKLDQTQLSKTQLGKTWLCKIQLDETPFCKEVF